MSCWRQRLTAFRIKASPWLMGLGVMAGVGVLGLIVTSCAEMSRTIIQPPEVAGASFVGNKTCADCHTNICRIFPLSAHARVDGAGSKMVGLTGCESCHGAGSKHVQGGGGRGKFIVNPGKDPTACFQCHLDVQAQFNLPQHHPVLEGQMNCVQCHDPHGSDIKKPAGGLAMARLNESCGQCHREQTRPKVFEHEALREGCVTCHNPHGSISAKMLVERDVNLCLRCHAQVQSSGPGGAGEIFIGVIPHSQMLRQATCWSAGCHSAVHGSNMNRQLMY
jgi:predicted CXXCH cytochrome family protein